RNLQNSFLRQKTISTVEEKDNEIKKQEKIIQRVSSYEDENYKKESMKNIILLVIFLLMVGLLISTFIFREKISEFLSDLL
ncbi:MAG: hypothetical protein QXU40_01530, partial [Candidatus Pacearchaeota archaeon]